MYVELTPDLNDYWLSSYYLEQDESLLVGEELMREAEARSDCKRWNMYHYRFQEIDEDEEDASNVGTSLIVPFDDEDDAETQQRAVEKMFNQLYEETQITLPSDTEEISKWVNEVVFKDYGISDEESSETERVFFG
jgi:hypothetical protein